jgi:FkbM family methyltransferase
MITSYAQNFEDVMLWRALSHIKKGFYIDIGAQDPTVDSVSLAFYEHGWRGINVEPSPGYAEALRRTRAEDVIVQAAVGSGLPLCLFFEISGTGISTVVPEIAEQHRLHGFDVKEIAVTRIPLSAVLDMRLGQEVHWLKIDVEGFERQVLDSWGSCPLRPWIVVIESTLPLTQTDVHEQWEPLLLSYGYEGVYFDGLNRFYVSEKHPELRDSFRAPPNVFDSFRLNGTGSAPFHKLLEERFADRRAKDLAQFGLSEQAANERINQLTGELAAINTDKSDREHAVRQLVADSEGEIERLKQMCAEQTLKLLEQRNAMHEETGGLLRSMLLREQQLGSELATMRQDAEKEKLALVNQFVEREACLQRELRETERGLTAKLRDAETGRYRLEHDCSDRIFSQVVATQAARDDHIAALKLLAQRELEAAVRMFAFQRNVDMERTRQANEHSERERVLAEKLDVTRADVQRLQRALSELEEHNAESFRSQFRAIEEAREERLAALTLLAQRERETAEQVLSARQNVAAEMERQTREHARKESALAAARASIAGLESSLAEKQGSFANELSRLSDVFAAREREYKEQLSTERAIASNRAEQLLNMQEHLDRIQASRGWRLTHFFVKSERSASAPSISRVIQPLDTQITIARTADQGSGPQSRTHESTMPSTAPRHSLDIKKNTASAADIKKDLGALLAEHDQMFVITAYRTILKRDPDSDGLRYYVGRLRSGYPKLHLLHQLRSSSESDVVGQQLPDLDRAIRQYRLAQMPVLGGIFRLFLRAERNLPSDCRLRAVENEIQMLREESCERLDALDRALVELRVDLKQQTESLGSKFQAQISVGLQSVTLRLTETLAENSAAIAPRTVEIDSSAKAVGLTAPLEIVPVKGDLSDDHSLSSSYRSLSPRGKEVFRNLKAAI